MAAIKSYTDLEQSKKLAEMLPIESADYHYIAQGENSYFYPYSLSSDAVKDYDEEIKYIPCWSLASLLDILQYPTLFQNGDGEWGCTVWIDTTKPYSISPKDSPIDACVAMIEKLNELKML